MNPQATLYPAGEVGREGRTGVYSWYVSDLGHWRAWSPGAVCPT